MSSALDTKLRRLRLGCMASSSEAQNAESLKHKHSYLEFLQALVDGELESRENKGLHKRIKSARFPNAKTLEDFSFDFQPKLDVKLIRTLAGCDFVERKQYVILVGQPGTGKTHLSIALGIKARQPGFDVCFTTVQELAARTARAGDLVAALLNPRPEQSAPHAPWTRSSTAKVSPMCPGKSVTYVPGCTT